MTDGVARTFLNACRHRGRSVAQGCFGHGRRITCPYHSWVYDSSGQLVGVPGKEAFDELDVDGLIEYPTVERGRRGVRRAHGRRRVRPRRMARRHVGSARDAATRQAPSPRRRDEAAAAGTGRRPPTATSTAITSATCIGTRSAPSRSPTATRSTCTARTCGSVSPTSRSPSCATSRPRNGPTTTPASRWCTTSSRTSRSRATPTGR